MESRTKAFGHPIHPMMIVLPVGLFVMAVVSDIIYLITQSSLFATVAFIDIAGGVIGGLLAAIFGFRDYLSIPTGTRARAVARNHGLGNVVVVVLFAISWLIRNGADTVYPPALALIFSFAGIILATVTAWLGGELVDRLGVGVDRGANLDAPSSLSGQPASAMTAEMVNPSVPPAHRVESVPVTGNELVDEDVEKRGEEHDVDEP
jgi:uncharacterized membrane protein